MIICLEGCRTQPVEFVGKQCSPVFFYEDIAGVQYINIERSSCLCRTYKVSKDYIGPISNTEIESIDVCNKIIGYSPKEYVALTNLLEYVRGEINSRPEVVTPEPSMR